MRRLLHILKCAAQGAVVIVAVGVTAILVMPRLLGWQVVTVLSGSMAPTYPTDSVLAVETVDPGDIQEGDVIAFQPEDRDRMIVTHRVVAVEGGGSSLAFVTKGDANDAEDQNPVAAGAVRGRVVFGVPHIGELVRAARSPWGFGAMLVVPAALVIVRESRSILRTVREDRKSRADSLEPKRIPEVQEVVVGASRSDFGPIEPLVLPTGGACRQLLLVLVALNRDESLSQLDGLVAQYGAELIGHAGDSVFLSHAAEPAMVASFEERLGEIDVTVLAVSRSAAVSLSFLGESRSIEPPLDLSSPPLELTSAGGGSQSAATT